MQPGFAWIILNAASRNYGAFWLSKHIAGRWRQTVARVQGFLHLLGGWLMLNRTRFVSVGLAIALSIPVAASQAPVAPAAPDQTDARILPASAGAYADFQGNVTEVMSKELGSVAELNRHVQTFGSVNINQLSSGWIAYGAILAAQNPEFARDVREADADYGRERTMAYFTGSPSWARSFDGADQALQAALTVNAHETARISSAGAFMDRQAFAIQSQKWGKARALDPQKTYASLRKASEEERPVSAAIQQAFSAPDLNVVLASLAASPATAQSIWDKVAVLTVSAPASAFQTLSPVIPAERQLEISPAYEGTANRILTLAAQHIIAAEQTHPEAMKATLADPTSRDCLADAKQLFFGCISAATHNDALTGCLAKHGLQIPREKTRSTGLCLSEIAR